MFKVCNKSTPKMQFRCVLRCTCVIKHLSTQSLKNGDRKIMQLIRMTSGPPMKIEGATNSVGSNKLLPK